VGTVSHYQVSCCPVAHGPVTFCQSTRCSHTHGRLKERHTVNFEVKGRVETGGAEELDWRAHAAASAARLRYPSTTRWATLKWPVSAPGTSTSAQAGRSQPLGSGSSTGT